MKTIEKTVNLFEAVDNGEVLYGDKKIILEVLCDDMDGIFETKQAWKDFIDEVDHYGSYYLIKEWLANEYTVIDTDNDRITYNFTSPIKVATGFKLVNGEREDVISEVSSITFQVEYEYSWSGRGQYAFMVDIMGKIVDMK